MSVRKKSTMHHTKAASHKAAKKVHEIHPAKSTKAPKGGAHQSVVL